MERGGVRELWGAERGSFEDCGGRGRREAQRVRK